MKRILCIGHASYDIIIPFDGYPIENTKNRVSKKVECGGGPASNAAYLLGKWHMKPTFIGVLGNDVYGQKIINEFKEAKVNVKRIELDNNYQTTLSFVIVNKHTGTRTILTHRHPKMKLNNLRKVKADLILVDGQELDASLLAIKNNPQAIKVIDAGSLKEENIILGKLVDYLVCSKEFAEDFTNLKINLDKPEIIKALFNKMASSFEKPKIIITLEDKGCLYTLNNKIKLMPSIKVKQVDSTGAGDFFHGAFVYGLAMGFDLEKTLKIANITGALSVTKMGRSASVYDLKEVMNLYEHYR